MGKVKFEGGPADGQIQDIDGDHNEYRIIENTHVPNVVERRAAFPRKEDNSYIEHIYKKSVNDPHIFWYAGSTN